MAKNKNDMNNLINEAIDVSIEFEKLMDSIDFNSYLFEDQKVDNIKQTVRYKTYKRRCEKALAFLNKITKKIPEEIRKDDFAPKNKDELAQYLVYHLFKAKRERLEGREQIRRKEEKKKYIDATHRLHKTLDQIPVKDFKVKLKALIKNQNWSKILYFNELAICYSGLAKSSMSLGYAEESISLLERLYSELKDIENKDDWSGLNSKVEEKEGYFNLSQIIKLCTFALYNKGEAERLLHEEDSALRTFQRINRIYDKSKESRFDASLSDHYSALLRKALILTDMGRGEEALKTLENIKVRKDSFQFVDRELELASVNIDRKEYEKAYKILNKFENPYWEYTFAKRKAKVYMLRLLNEFKKNRPKDFQEINESTKVKSVLRKIKKIKKKYAKFAKDAKEILRDAAQRQDWDNFKKTCIYLAEYYRHTKEDSEKALKCFYLYLFESPENKYADNFGDIIDDWLADKSLAELLKDYKGVGFYKKLDRTEDEKYLQGFFDVYVSDTKSELAKNLKDTKTLSKRKKIVEKLKDRLVYVFSQKDNDIELERAEKKYEDFLEGFGKEVRGRKEKPETFIEDYFFKNSREGMWAESIVDQMERNTSKFVKNVVGTSKIHNGKKEKLKGILSVLRRWNSFTPALSSPVNQSKGGGYFLHFSYNEESLGIVIDPGYDFLENFFSQGFKIGDIDLVLVSHAHPDHTDNLGSILSLFYEMNGRLGKYYHKKNVVNKKTLTLILSPGVFEHYSRIIKPSEQVLKDTIVVNVRETTLETPYKFTSRDEKVIVEIQAFATSHRDLSQFQSLGFKVIAEENGTSKTVIGYTGDAKWDLNKWPEHFQNCDIVCAHLGSIVNILDERDFCNTFCEKFTKNDNDNKCTNLNECRKSAFEDVNVTKAKTVQQTREENHLYLAGLASFFDFVSSNNDRLKVGIVSEFGEELKNGIRMDLYKRFDDYDWFTPEEKREKKKFKCLPGDIGLQVDVFTGDVYCHCCGRFVERNGIEPIAYGKEEAICFVCKACKGVLSSYQIGEKLKNFCENGRTLKLADESK